MAPREWLDVPFARKDEAKAAGARWDPQARSWYAPRPGMAGLARWARIPMTLIGEDREFGSGLFTDPVPSSAWFTNVRSAVSVEDWERLRQMVYRRAGGKCEACGAERDRERQRWLEAHERFAYLVPPNAAGHGPATRAGAVRETARGARPPAGVQRLVRLVCLCTPCHEATHFGRAQVTGRAQHALQQLCGVNGWSEAQAWAHVNAAAEQWAQRSTMVWDLDLSLLTNNGIAVAAPPDAEQRPDHARAGLDALDEPPRPREHRTAPAPRSGPDFEPEPGVSVRAVGPGGGGDDPMSRILRGQPPFRR